MLGVTIASTLDGIVIFLTYWKANKRMFFLILLKRAKVPVRDIISFYPTCIRPVLEYCAPSFFFFEPIVSNTEHKRPHFFHRRTILLIILEINVSLLTQLCTPNVYPRHIYQPCVDNRSVYYSWVVLANEMLCRYICNYS